MSIENEKSYFNKKAWSKFPGFLYLKEVVMHFLLPQTYKI